MKIYAIYKEEPDDTQVMYGGNADPRGVLEVGKSYEVDKFEVHSSTSRLYLKDHPTEGFNTVNFEFEPKDALENEFRKYRSDRGYDW